MPGLRGYACDMNVGAHIFNVIVRAQQGLCTRLRLLP
jgi:hypothetical protein